MGWFPVGVQVFLFVDQVLGHSKSLLCPHEHAGRMPHGHILHAYTAHPPRYPHPPCRGSHAARVVRDRVGRGSLNRVGDPRSLLRTLALAACVCPVGGLWKKAPCCCCTRGSHAARVVRDRVCKISLSLVLHGLCVRDDTARQGTQNGAPSCPGCYFGCGSAHRTPG